MAQIIRAATPPTTPPIRAPRLGAAPELLDSDDGDAVLAWLPPRTEDNAVTWVASNVVDVVAVAVVVGVSEAVCVSEVVVVSKLVDEVDNETVNGLCDDNEIDESVDEVVDKDVLLDERSGIPILAVIAVKPATDVASGTEVLKASSPLLSGQTPLVHGSLEQHPRKLPAVQTYHCLLPVQLTAARGNRSLTSNDIIEMIWCSRYREISDQSDELVVYAN
ncbi:hypothetical protein PENANT_c017G06407 [Penicillium antarcticum]|uniref:Uncharacterized protein n=1 Tax=Penicillium antarcticum TaxID=416450 RepID=A0A1V6Q281_9EURO|nr:uncharacterized protein N7508_005435 [Penicillium antarcticum]KAJ5306420.1 hypothetical protein N7508_005435 [Penicillium antarcticum]OQD83339.1 hypothetical protein PENANT_c017G06407 [Penicillium antarcticum]